MTARAVFFSARNPAPPPEFDPERRGAKLPAPPIPGRGLNGIRLCGMFLWTQSNAYEITNYKLNSTLYCSAV